MEEEEKTEDRPGVINLKVEVLSGRYDRWIKILD